MWGRRGREAAYRCRKPSFHRQSPWRCACAQGAGQRQRHPCPRNYSQLAMVSNDRTRVDGEIEHDRETDGGSDIVVPGMLPGNR